MSNSIRQIIRNLIRENYQEELLDLILDKVSKYGEQSLNDHEKSLLSRMSSDKLTLKNDVDLAYDTLDFNIGKMKQDSYLTDKIGKKVSGIKYFDKNNNLVFDLEMDSEVLGVKKEQNHLYADRELYTFLKHTFDISDEDAKEMIKRWFEKYTGMNVSKIDFWFSGF